VAVDQAGDQQELFPTDFLGPGIPGRQFMVGTDRLNLFPPHRYGPMSERRLVMSGHDLSRANKQNVLGHFKDPFLSQFINLKMPFQKSLPSSLSQREESSGQALANKSRFLVSHNHSSVHNYLDTQE
jgi:hypothetical protein